MAHGLLLNAERRTPNAERRTPNAERRTPNAERRTPNAERRTPNAERRTPNAERRTPNAERRTPNAERRTLHPLTSSRPDTRTGRRRARLSRLFPALALLLGALSPFAAAPAAAEVLVSTISQSNTRNLTTLDYQHYLQGFTTGADAGGYRLTSIDFKFAGSDSDPGTLRAELWSANTDGTPGAKLKTLTYPSTYTAGIRTATAPAGTILKPGTKYFAVVYRDRVRDPTTPSSYVIKRNPTAPTARAGWSLDDRYYWGNIGVGFEADVDPPDALLIRVNGHVAVQSSLPPCTYDPGTPPPDLVISEWPRELAGLEWDSNDSGSFRRGFWSPAAPNGKAARDANPNLPYSNTQEVDFDRSENYYHAYVLFGVTEVFIKPTLPATPRGVLMTVASDVTAPVCATSGEVVRVGLRPGHTSTTDVVVRLGGNGTFNNSYRIKFIKQQPLKVSFATDAMEITEGEAARIPVQLDYALHYNEGVCIPLKIENVTPDGGDWYLDHSSPGGCIGRGQSVSRELIVRTHPDGIQRGPDETDILDDDGDEEFRVSIDFDKLHADYDHLTVGPVARPVDEGFAFEAGDHTSITVAVKDPDDQNTDPNSIITGPGLVVSATDLGVSVGGTATYTVRLGAPPTDIVAVTPTVDDGTKASVSPEQLVFSQADWNEAQTVKVSGAAAGETSIHHSVSTQDQALRFATMPTVKVTVSSASGNQVGAGDGGPQPQTDNSALISQMYEWRNDPQWSSYRAHTDRWDRALLALGETVSDGNLTPMTAAEAQAFVDQGWTRWVTVAAALAAKEAENAGGSEPTSPYADLIAQMVEWRNDPQWSSYKSHTDRWDRALLAFGETVSDTTLTAMTAAEAQAFADQGWTRWVEVAKALKEIESAGNQPPTAPTATATVSLSATPNPVDEGSQVRVTVTLSAPLDWGLLIPLVLTDGTAETGDRGNLSGIRIEGGFLSATGSIAANDDADYDDETFTVAIDSQYLPTEVAVGSPSSVVVEINDDDTRPQQQSLGPYVPPDPDPQTGNQNPVDKDTPSGDGSTGDRETNQDTDSGDDSTGDREPPEDTPPGDESAQEDTSPELWEGTSGRDALQGGPGSDEMYGYGGHDYLFGHGGHDVIYGGAGNDVLNGGEGNDKLHGGSGDDRLTGGPGADRFVVSSSDTGDKRILDFDRGDGDGDRIVLRTEDGAGPWLSVSEIIADVAAEGTGTWVYDLEDDLYVVTDNIRLTADDFVVE